MCGAPVKHADIINDRGGLPTGAKSQKSQLSSQVLKETCRTVKKRKSTFLFVTYSSELHACVSLSLALCLLWGKIKSWQRTAQATVVFISLGNETTSGQSKGVQDTRRG